MPTSQRGRVILLWLALLGAFYYVMGTRDAGKPSVERIQTSDFISHVEDGEIGWVRITNGSAYGISKDRSSRYASYTADPKILRDVLRAKGIPFQEAPPSDSGGLLALFQILLFIGVAWFVIRTMRNMGPGASGGPVKQFMAHQGKLAETVKERFIDVAGNDEAVAEIADVVQFLKDPEGFGRLGARMPRGLLLVGPPGTGKTLLARALAGEAEVPFLSISGSEFVEVFVGVGAGRMRSLFEEARKHKSCIIFIDELDAMGKARASGPFSGGNNESEQTLNQLLTEMDGFNSTQGVVVVAATNKPESIDAALMRPGRFDRQVQVLPPSKTGRVAILDVHIRKRGVPVSDTLDKNSIASATPGLTGADIANLVNEAALLATKAGKQVVETEDFHAAIERVALGAKRSGHIMSQKDKETVAWHEAGHAVVAWFSPDADLVHRVSIIPRGQALGVTWTVPKEDRFLYTKQQLLTKIRVFLGGRIAEIGLLGEDNYTTGASDDLARVSDLARKMVTRFGMSKLGMRAFGRVEHGYLGEQETRDFGDKIASDIDTEVQCIVTECAKEAIQLLKRHGNAVEALANALIAEETVNDQRLLEILGPRPA